MSLILTPEEAFEAGFAESCDHSLDPTECPACRLTEAEIGRSVVLLRSASELDPSRTTAA